MVELNLAVFGFRGLEAQLGCLVLELGHALKFAYRGKTGEDPGQFGMTDDMRLGELMGFFRVKPTGHVLGHAVVNVLPQGGRVSRGRDGMQVDDAEIAFVVFQHVRPVAHRSQVVSQGELSRGLGACEDHLLFFPFGLSHKVVTN